jgi:hypothetical protein
MLIGEKGGNIVAAVNVPSDTFHDNVKGLVEKFDQGVYGILIIDDELICQLRRWFSVSRSTRGHEEDATANDEIAHFPKLGKHVLTVLQTS